MFNAIKKLFAGKQSDDALSVDSITEKVCDYVIAATSNLILSKEIAEKTRMAPLLVLPVGKQYIAGTLLNVLSYSCCKICEDMKPLNSDVILGALSRRMGKFCTNGFKNVDEIGEAMENSAAPLPSNLPIVSRCLVAETCIHAWFQKKVPTNEFDVFRREYLKVAEKLCNDVSSDNYILGQNSKKIVRPEERTLICPECGASFSVNEYAKILVSEKPFLKKLLLDGKLFQYKCTNCGLSGQLSYESFYVDDTRKLVVHFVPDSKRIKEFKDAGLYENLSKVYRAYICRIVCSVDELREIIKIVDDDLDYYAINVLKYVFIMPHKKLDELVNYSSDSFQVFYDGITNGKITYTFTTANLECSYVEMSDWESGYQELYKKLSETGNIVKRGIFVYNGALSIAKIMEKIADNDLSPEERLLRAIFGEDAVNNQD